MVAVNMKIVLYVLKVLTPLLRVLRLVCAVRWSEKMGYDVWDMCNLKNARRSA